MTFVPFDALACPLDGDPLRREGNSWLCSAGHSFDVAKQGYVHLLPVQKKRSRDPGDSKDMVAARQRFLNRGCYEQVSTAVNRAVIEALPPEQTARILDAGCGEGYYLRRLAAALPAGRCAALLGVDISKWAVLAAARQDKQMSWVVGSNANLPVLPATVDAVLCLFGFPVYSEFARVLRQGGQLLQLDAGPDHLVELREIIYPELKADRTKAAVAPEGFRIAGEDRLNYQLELPDRDTISDLLAMTPHLYRASYEGREKAASLTRLTVTVDVLLQRFEKV